MGAILTAAENGLHLSVASTAAELKAGCPFFTAGAESVAVSSRFVRPRNLLAVGARVGLGRRGVVCAMEPGSLARVAMDGEAVTDSARILEAGPS